MAPKEIDCNATDEIVCPHCGHEHSDSWEWFAYNEHERNVVCSDCDKPFRAIAEYRVSYWSEPIENTGLEGKGEE